MTARATENLPEAERPELPHLVKPADVARIFGCSERTLRRWAHRGVLVPITMGRSVFYHPDHVRNALVDQIAHGAFPEAARRRSTTPKAIP